MRFPIVPLQSVGDLRIGMTRDEVRAIMGVEPDAFAKIPNAKQLTDSFHDSCVQVFYDPDDRAEYIELSRAPSIDPEFEGLHIFNTPATELVLRLGSETVFDSDPDLNPTEVTFPDLSMSLWRPCGDVTDDLDSKYFMTVGIGRPGYYSVEEEVEQVGDGDAEEAV